MASGRPARLRSHPQFPGSFPHPHLHLAQPLSHCRWSSLLYTLHSSQITNSFVITTHKSFQSEFRLFSVPNLPRVTGQCNGLRGHIARVHVLTPPLPLGLRDDFTSLGLRVDGTVTSTVAARNGSEDTELLRRGAQVSLAVVTAVVTDRVTVHNASLSAAVGSLEPTLCNPVFSLGSEIEEESLASQAFLRLDFPVILKTEWPHT